MPLRAEAHQAGRTAGDQEAEKQQGLFRETYYVSKVEPVAAGGEETLEGE